MVIITFAGFLYILSAIKPIAAISYVINVLFTLFIIDFILKVLSKREKEKDIQSINQDPPRLKCIECKHIWFARKGLLECPKCKEKGL